MAVKTLSRADEAARQPTDAAPTAGQAVDAAIEHQARVYFAYDPAIEAELTSVGAAIGSVPSLAAAYNSRWLAVQLLEGDAALGQHVASMPDAAPVMAALADSRARLHDRYGPDLDVVLADRRYAFVHQLVQASVSRRDGAQVGISDRIDRYAAHPVIGVFIFLALMWVVFKVTADVSAPYLNWIDAVISGPITRWTVALLGAVGLGDTWVQALAVDGVIAGVGGVLVFVPVLMSLYLVLAILEDSGYMARAALVMDRLMGKLGLQGKSFLPMVVGFGCSVPALYATRTLENRRDRILTGLLVPFMSCSARLPVYVLFAAIFYPQRAGLVIFSMYLLGIAVAMAVGLLLKSTILRSDEQSAFLLELPPYRLPTWRNIWRQMWGRTSSFIHNAWTLILVVSVVLWVLLAVPMRSDAGSFAAVEIDESVFGVTSAAVAPLFAPMGFGTWQATGSLATGFVAKEVVIATMAQIYAVDVESDAAGPQGFLRDLAEIGTGFVQATWDTVKSLPLIVGVNLFDSADEPPPTALMNAIQVDFEAASGGHGALAGLAFMVFVLLYTPCMVAIAAERQELGVRWMWLSVLGQFAIAWLAALIIFQGGRLLF